MARFEVKRTGRTWGVFKRRGELVEGGFFTRAAADRAREEWEASERAGHQRDLEGTPVDRVRNGE